MGDQFPPDVLIRHAHAISQDVIVVRMWDTGPEFLGAFDPAKLVTLPDPVQVDGNVYWTPVAGVSLRGGGHLRPGTYRLRAGMDRSTMFIVQ